MIIITDNEKIEILHRRVVMTDLPVTQIQFGSSYWFFSSSNSCYLVGSSNGLICFAIDNSHLLLANPLTRQVKKLKNRPQCPNRDTNVYCYYAENSLCWGFGYDSVMDDYMVMVGFIMKSEYVTCFHVLSLKSNVWKLVGQVKYSHFSITGVLCNGALHWLMVDVNENKVILSIDLSENKFKEIPQPDDVMYQSFIGRSARPMLGTIEECLCIFDREWLPQNLWKMNDYNVMRSWEMVGHDDWENKNDVVHFLQEPDHRIPYDKLGHECIS
ncbi:F-box/kelch-repeat protein At3g06240-like [Rutidosis leptorrhynchoides]|uniref:F-box/kelch-repeat protein At3g06240-like n=1 Tax=Rutidosis leptorrhynchoides TaxID=125765 RepID=UPI003A99B622